MYIFTLDALAAVWDSPDAQEQPAIIDWVHVVAGRGWPFGRSDYFEINNTKTRGGAARLPQPMSTPTPKGKQMEVEIKRDGEEVNKVTPGTLLLSFSWIMCVYRWNVFLMIMKRQTSERSEDVSLLPNGRLCSCACEKIR